MTEFVAGDSVVDREPFYALGPSVVVVGTVKRVDEMGVWCVGLRLPALGDGELADWNEAHLFDASELRAFRPKVDKPYFLRASDLGFLVEKSTVEARKPLGCAKRRREPSAVLASMNEGRS